ncbi:MAG TPA: DUF362 domain-containing protein, partial [Polyangiaceae bacterium]
PEHAATLSGTVTYGPEGSAARIVNGNFNVFSIDPETGHRQMVYEFEFSLATGERYCLRGVKRIFDDPGFDMVADLTTLYVTLTAGGGADAPVIGAGKIFFNLLNAPRLLASMTVTGAPGFGAELTTKLAFLSFAYGEVRDTYLADINPIYDANYQNLVVSGQLRTADGRLSPFFLVSGVHSPNFPWGDGESFADVMLVIGDRSGEMRRFALTKRVIDGLTLNIETGTYRYRGALVALHGQSTLAFSEIQAAPASMTMVVVDIELHFDAKRHALAPFPFNVRSELLDRLATRLRDTLQRILPSESLFGYHCLPHSIGQLQGTLSIDAGNGAVVHHVVEAQSFGHAEDSTLRSVREPTLLYGYICAMDLTRQSSCVQFHASSLRNEREYWGKDRLDAWLGALISHSMSKQIAVTKDTATVLDLGDVTHRFTQAEPFRRIGAPLLELRNDHYPTAAFLRRIVLVENAAGERQLALEEAMDPLRREPIGTERSCVIACIRDSDKRAALVTAVTASGLLSALSTKCKRLGKSRETLGIVIKPNFMFAYDKLDRTTYTDPELVEMLVEELLRAGYQQIKVVEAQSTYGEFFEGRSVREVAGYLGYSLDGSRGYGVIDLTCDQKTDEYLGPNLGQHPVPLTWQRADFRISFAKNKTHSYAHYTLTLKNIYGALCLANKFKEYHVERDIYRTTLEYLTAYPIDFGIIDAHVSADGPFGIFADADPNLTHTIIAGEDLVAVDWVGASKMGLDPMVSPYMRLAVAAFGKPRIELVGDGDLYRPWLNVPRALPLLAHGVVDANYHFGHLLYLASAHMDAAQFPLKPHSDLVTLARAAMEPVREAAFLQAGGHRSWSNRALCKLEEWLGQ